MQYCEPCNVQTLKVSDTHEYKECGLTNVWLQDWPGYRCPNCNVFVPLLPDTIDNFIAEKVLVIGRHLNADEILFLRTAMGLRPGELAQVIEVKKRKLVRAENGAELLDAIADSKL